MLIRFFLIRMDQGEDEADDHGDEADAEEDEEYGEEGLHQAGALRRAAVFFLYKDSDSGAFLSQKVIESL